MHAKVVSVLGLCIEMRATPSCSEKGSWVTIPLLLMIGFLLMDLGVMLVCDVWMGLRPIDKAQVFHHVFILVFFAAGLTNDVYIWFGATLLINEASTPFLNILHYLQSTHQKKKTQRPLLQTVPRSPSLLFWFVSNLSLSTSISFCPVECVWIRSAVSTIGQSGPLWLHTSYFTCSILCGSIHWFGVHSNH